VVPWEGHFRSPNDFLLDIAVLLPSIFSRADRVRMDQPGTDRNFRAKELLNDCASIERQFELWYIVVQQIAADEGTSMMYWTDNTTIDGHLPFISRLVFSRPRWCLVHIYYWSFLLCLHQCIHSLLEIMLNSSISDPTGPARYADIPPGMDIMKYQVVETKKLAENVCRSLDNALKASLHVELLSPPLRVVSEFYSQLRLFEEVEMECLWCNGFRARMQPRVYEVSDMVREKKWTEVRRFM
jgi:(R)-2-hydroxyglutarate---pyruvate transhydrogenase